MRAVFISFVILLSGMSGCFEDSVIASEDRGVPGGLVVACLSPSIPKMVLEIDYEEGYRPHQDSVDLLKTRLLQVCDKPGSCLVLYLG